MKLKSDKKTEINSLKEIIEINTIPKILKDTVIQPKRPILSNNSSLSKNWGFCKIFGFYIKISIGYF